MEKLVQTLGIAKMSKSQVSELAKSLDSQVAAFRTRPMDAGPYTYLWIDAMTQRVREDGRIVNVSAWIATGVNVDGHREILGVDVATGFTRPRARPSRGEGRGIEYDERIELLKDISDPKPLKGAAWVRPRDLPAERSVGRRHPPLADVRRSRDMGTGDDFPGVRLPLRAGPLRGSGAALPVRRAHGATVQGAGRGADRRGHRPGRVARRAGP